MECVESIFAVCNQSLCCQLASNWSFDVLESSQEPQTKAECTLLASLVYPSL